MKQFIFLLLTCTTLFASAQEPKKYSAYYAWKIMPTLDGDVKIDTAGYMIDEGKVNVSIGEFKISIFDKSETIYHAVKSFNRETDEKGQTDLWNELFTDDGRKFTAIFKFYPQINVYQLYILDTETFSGTLYQVEPSSNQKISLRHE